MSVYTDAFSSCHHYLSLLKGDNKFELSHYSLWLCILHFSETYLLACLVDFFTNCPRYTRYVCTIIFFFSNWFFKINVQGFRELAIVGLFCFSEVNLVLVRDATLPAWEMGQRQQLHAGSHLPHGPSPCQCAAAMFGRDHFWLASPGNEDGQQRC